MKFIEWTPQALQDFDAVVISTDHDCIDWQLLIDHASLVIDTRNALSDFNKNDGYKIVKA